MAPGFASAEIDPAFPTGSVITWAGGFHSSCVLYRLQWTNEFRERRHRPKPVAATATWLGILVSIDMFGGLDADLAVPQSYVSDNPLSRAPRPITTRPSPASAGTYVWTWGAGADADSFTLQIGAAAPVPEPSSLVLLALPLGIVLLLVRPRRPARRAP